MSELYELTMQQTMQQTSQEDRQRILSEDYVSLIFHTQNSPFDPTEILEELLPQVVNRKYVILNAPLAEFPPDIASQGYYSIPKLFTLLDTASLEASGIRADGAGPADGTAGLLCHLLFPSRESGQGDQRAGTAVPQRRDRSSLPDARVSVRRKIRYGSPAGFRGALPLPSLLCPPLILTDTAALWLVSRREAWMKLHSFPGQLLSPQSWW